MHLKCTTERHLKKSIKTTLKINHAYCVLRQKYQGVVHVYEFGKTMCDNQEN